LKEKKITEQVSTFLRCQHNSKTGRRKTRAKVFPNKGVSLKMKSKKIDFRL
jgi:hypothetical protein